jgi:hypothetical protein
MIGVWCIILLLRTAPRCCAVRCGAATRCGMQVCFLGPWDVDRLTSAYRMDVWPLHPLTANESPTQLSSAPVAGRFARRDG